MRERDSSFESYMRNDLTNQIADLKGIIMNLNIVMDCGFQHLSLLGKDNVQIEKALGFIGVSAYVSDKVNEELSIILEALDTI